MPSEKNWDAAVRRITTSPEIAREILADIATLEAHAFHLYGPHPVGGWLSIVWDKLPFSKLFRALYHGDTFGLPIRKEALIDVRDALRRLASHGARLLIPLQHSEQCFSFPIGSVEALSDEVAIQVGPLSMPGQDNLDPVAKLYAILQQLRHASGGFPISEYEAWWGAHRGALSDVTDGDPLALCIGYVAAMMSFFQLGAQEAEKSEAPLRCAREAIRAARLGTTASPC